MIPWPLWLDFSTKVEHFHLWTCWDKFPCLPQITFEKVFEPQTSPETSWKGVPFTPHKVFGWCWKTLKLENIQKKANVQSRNPRWGVRFLEDQGLFEHFERSLPAFSGDPAVQLRIKTHDFRNLGTWNGEMCVVVTSVAVVRRGAGVVLRQFYCTRWAPINSYKWGYKPYK